MHLMTNTITQEVYMIEEMDIKEDIRVEEEVVDPNALTMVIFPIDNSVIHILKHFLRC